MMGKIEAVYNLSKHFLQTSTNRRVFDVDPIVSQVTEDYDIVGLECFFISSALAAYSIYYLDYQQARKGKDTARQEKLANNMHDVLYYIKSLETSSVEKIASALREKLLNLAHSKE